MGAMPFALIGLESALGAEDCDRVELGDESGGVGAAFVREGPDAWAAEDPESDPLHARELVELIQRDFGRTYARLACFVGSEKVVYAFEKGAVRVRRVPRAAEDSGAEARRADLAPLADALGIPGTKRKAKLKQARQFAAIVERALGKPSGRELHVLDLACGRSYLGFVLVHLLSAGGRRVVLHGIDSDATLVGKCCEIADSLHWAGCAFETADLASYSAERGTADIVVSLHGCDTLTDDAIRIAWEARGPLLFVAPCCQHELRHQWGRHPLDWMSRYGLLEQRLADVLTDGFRCLVLEALGYQVKTIRFTAPDVTPKNLLIQGRLTSGPRPARVREAVAFMKQFGVQPSLAAVLETAGLARLMPT